MKKKILSIGLVLLLSVMLIFLTGCGDTEDEEEETETKSSVTDEEETNIYEEDAGVLKNAKKDESAENQGLTEDALAVAVTGIQSEWLGDYYTSENAGTLDSYITEDALEEELNNL